MCVGRVTLFLRLLGGTCSLSLPASVAASFLVLWPHHLSLCLGGHTACIPLLFVSDRLLSLFYKDTVIESRAHLGASG